MGSVRYTGFADVRELRSEDLQKAGVEGFRFTKFPQGVDVAVEDNVAEALVNSPLLGGGFEHSPEPSEDDDEELEDDDEVDPGGTPQTGVGTNETSTPSGPVTTNTSPPT